MLSYDDLLPISPNEINPNGMELTRSNFLAGSLPRKWAKYPIF